MNAVSFFVRCMMLSQLSTTSAKRPSSRVRSDGFAAQQSDLLAVLAGADQVETKIGLKALLLEIKRDQWPADQMV